MSSVNNNLSELRELAGSDSSVGYIVTNKENKLTKAAHHKHLTHLNAAPQETNSRWAREDVYRAFEEALSSKSSTQSAQKFLALAAKKLGVEVTQTNGFTNIVAQESTPLERRTVRALLMSFDFFVGEKAVNAKTADNKALATLIEGIEPSDKPFISEDTPTRMHAREVCTKVLLAKLGPVGFKVSDVNSLPTPRIKSLTLSLLNSEAKTPAQLKAFKGMIEAEIARIKGSEKINMQEMNELVAAYEKTTEEEQELVQIAGKDAVEGPTEKPVTTEEKAKAENEKIEKLIENPSSEEAKKKEAQEAVEKAKQFFSWLGKNVGLVEKTEADLKAEEAQRIASEKEAQAKEEARLAAEQKGVEGFLADLAYDEDTWRMDEKGPGEKLAYTLEKHVDDLVNLLKNADRYLGVGDEAGILRTPALEVAEELVTEMKAMFAEQKLSTDASSVVLKGSILMALKLPSTVDTLTAVQAKIDKAIEEKFNAVQAKVEKTFTKLFGKSKGVTKFEAGEKNLAALMRQFGEKVPAEWSEKLEDVKTTNAQGYKKSAAVIQKEKVALAEKKKARLVDQLEKSRALLDKMLGSSAFDPSKGYGKFMSLAMKSYFGGVSILDKRAMLAAGIRYAKPEVKLPPPEKMPKDPEKAMELTEAIEKKNDMNLMGAVFKGAGPIMQKMLQGLASVDCDADFKLALEDMKSNLAPIPETIVKATLLDMIKRSHGKVTAITDVVSLGAASVGQAFLCKLHLAEGGTKEVVVKMLRPDAEQRFNREKAIFLAAAEQTEGMKVTFDGQLASILEELDLRVEAGHTSDGKVYDGKVPGTVSSMKLNDIIAPTKFTMVAEKAPGVTVDKLFKNLDKTVGDVVKPYIEKAKNKAGEEVTDVSRFFDKGTQLEHKQFTHTPEGDKAFRDQLMKDFGKLADLYEKTVEQQKMLIELTEKWCLEGIYESGYYHGDLHAGNIMVDNQFTRDDKGKLVLNTTDANGVRTDKPGANKGLTVIDFGNATKLTQAQQTNIISMMAAAGVKDTNRFLEGYKALMSEAGRADFEKNRKVIHDMVHNIFNLGTQADAGKRIAIVLGNLQTMGYELPAPIFKFSQCQLRLQGTVDEMNRKLEMIGNAMKLLGAQVFKKSDSSNHPDSIGGELFDDFFGSRTTSKTSPLAKLEEKASKLLKQIEVNQSGNGREPILAPGEEKANDVPKAPVAPEAKPQDEEVRKPEARVFKRGVSGHLANGYAESDDPYHRLLSFIGSSARKDFHEIEAFFAGYLTPENPLSGEIKTALEAFKADYEKDGGLLELNHELQRLQAKKNEAQKGVDAIEEKINPFNEIIRQNTGTVESYTDTKKFLASFKGPHALQEAGKSLHNALQEGSAKVFAYMRSSECTANIAKAQATIDAQEAQLRQAREGGVPAEIEKAEALLKLAKRMKDFVSQPDTYTSSKDLKHLLTLPLDQQAVELERLKTVNQQKSTAYAFFMGFHESAFPDIENPASQIPEEEYQAKFEQYVMQKRFSPEKITQMANALAPGEKLELDFGTTIEERIAIFTDLQQKCDAKLAQLKNQQKVLSEQVNAKFSGPIGEIKEQRKSVGAELFEKNGVPGKAERLAALYEQCQINELRQLKKSLQSQNEQVKTDGRSQFLSPKDFCDSLGNVINGHRLVSAKRMGMGTLFEYWVTKKLDSDTEQVPRV